MIILTIKFIVVPSVKNKKIKSYACMHLQTKKLLSKNGGLKSFNTKKLTSYLQTNKKKTPPIIEFVSSYII